MSDPNCEHLNYSVNPQSSQHPLCLARRAHRKTVLRSTTFSGCSCSTLFRRYLAREYWDSGRQNEHKGELQRAFHHWLQLRDSLYATCACASHLPARVHTRCGSFLLVRVPVSSISFARFAINDKQTCYSGHSGMKRVVLDRLPARYSPDGVLRLCGSRGRGESFTIHECTVTAVSYRYVESLLSAASIAAVFHRASSSWMRTRQLAQEIS